MRWYRYLVHNHPPPPPLSQLLQTAVLLQPAPPANYGLISTDQSCYNQDWRLQSRGWNCSNDWLSWASLFEMKCFNLTESEWVKLSVLAHFVLDTVSGVIVLSSAVLSLRLDQMIEWKACKYEYCSQHHHTSSHLNYFALSDWKLNNILPLLVLSATELSGIVTILVIFTSWFTE